MTDHAGEYAAIYVPAAITDPTEFARVAAPCLERVAACGYRLVGIVRDWLEVLRMAISGRVHVLIVADMSMLPADRQPRIETSHDPVRSALVPMVQRLATHLRRPRVVR